jgi:hypothetical protein
LSGFIVDAWADSTPVNIAQRVDQVESIELARRNWENVGTDTRISSDGRYVVQALLPGGRSKLIRQGELSPMELREIVQSLEDAGFYTLSDEYNAPFRTERSWWGYQLTVVATGRSKTVRFHSEDQGVPTGLKTTVETIMRMTSSER